MNKSSSNYKFKKNYKHKKYNKDNNNIKTTNINVLLNRVKLDQKKILTKNYYFL